MNQTTNLQRLKNTLQASVSPYHCIIESSSQLKEAGFEELPLNTPWKLQEGGSYYINAFDSTLIGFTVGNHLEDRPALRLAASHTDWPCLKLKPSPEVTTGQYGKLNVEVYGGPTLSTWMDRPLSMAGKVCSTGTDAFHPVTTLVNFARPLITIPNLPIHVNREVNNGVALNPQIDMLPLCTLLTEKLEKDNFFLNLLSQEANVKKEDILDYEIYIYNCDEGITLGFDHEFFSSPRLDNITSVQACLSGLIDSPHEQGIHVIALYDNEEVGNHTKQGAASSLMDHILEKIYLSLGYGKDVFLDALLGGFLLSIDVAHAHHPNHMEKYDIKNHIFMGDGIALKLSASQSYATDAASASVIEGLCRLNQIPYKKFSNRSDAKGGSTLGSVSSCLLSMRTVDIGIPLLAMHSARELMCAKDQTALVCLVKAYFGA